MASHLHVQAGGWFPGSSGRARPRRGLGIVMAFVLALGGCLGDGDDAVPAQAPQPPSLPSPPLITTQPADQTVVIGSDARFEVIASGDNLAYQWQRSNDQGTTWVDVVDATSTALTLPTVAQTDNGAWLRVTVRNASDATIPVATSRAAVLNVTPVIPPPPGPPPPPVIVSQPASAAVVEGQSATFTVSATGTTPLSYQWQVSSDGTTFTDIAGASSASYTTPATALTDDKHQYRVLVTDAGGTTPSANAVLTVAPQGPLPPPPPPPSSTSLNECYRSLGVTTGASSHVVLTSGSGTQTQDTVINGTAMFATASALEMQTTIVDSAVPGAVSVIKTYFNLDGSTGWATSYGYTGHVTSVTPFGPTVTADTTAVATPPWVTAQFAILAGQSAAFSTDFTITTSLVTTTGGVAGPPSTSTTTAPFSAVETFVGTETITVPAGSFRTCKYTREDRTSNTSSTHWVLAPYGIDIKTTGADGSTMSAKSILVNGSPP